MSYDIKEWARRQRVGDMTAKAVLMALANYADAGGVCWPSRQAISEWVECSMPTVTRKIGFLIELGLITAEKRNRDDGSQTSNSYVLQLQKEVRVTPEPKAEKTQEAPSLPPDQNDQPHNHSCDHAPSSQVISPPDHSCDQPRTTIGTSIGTKDTSPSSPRVAPKAESIEVELEPAPVAQQPSLLPEEPESPKPESQPGPPVGRVDTSEPEKINGEAVACEISPLLLEVESSKKQGPDFKAAVADLEAKWNAMAARTGLSKILVISEARRKRAISLLKRPTFRDNVDAILLRLELSDFCTGRLPSRSWKADFDWLLQPEAHVKLLEGRYDNRETTQRVSLEGQLRAIEEIIALHPANPESRTFVRGSVTPEQRADLDQTRRSRFDTIQKIASANRRPSKPE